MSESKALQVLQLSNGLPLVLQPMPAVSSAAVLVLAKVGSRYETNEEAGIAHFVEHMVFKGTVRRPSTLDIAAAIEGVGGDFNAFTAKDHTGFYVKTAAKDAQTSLDVLSDMLFNSVFAHEEVDRERLVILEEMNMYNDSPQDKVGELYDALVYPGQPLGREIIGSKESLHSLNSADLQAFNRKWYGADGLLIGVAGAIDVQQVKDWAESCFGGRESGDWSQAEAAVVEQIEPALRLQHKDTDQTHMVLGVRTFGQYDQRRYALSLLNAILGGTMSSRLFTEVRERRGLAYSIHTGVDAAAEVGSLVCQVGLEHGRVEEALKVIMEQFVKIRDEGVTEEELQRAKRYIRGRMALSLEDPLSLNIFAAKQQLMRGGVELLDQMMLKTEAVSSADIKALAAEIMNSRGLNAVVLGPKGDEVALKKALTLG